ncbi:MAG: hypothetical protein DRR16_33775 [Candidatus Parabeggiatoa sp. nov. 3]|nr:MAG: hypothetical protein DRR00_22440 [Gammaproteobacteria bacterium]RKZ72747.1 MAG: hypothetical protein DRR16_33775 [Gammaproteobacteria bacterium]
MHDYLKIKIDLTPCQNLQLNFNEKGVIVIFTKRIKALRYNLDKTKTRRVEFPTLFSAGEVFVISEQPADNFNDLLAASQSRLKLLLY